jgi:hypothetical protein
MESQRENTPEIEREARLREQAHRLWEKDGRPEGKDKVHWEQAVLELEGETPERASSKNRGK